MSTPGWVYSSVVDWIARQAVNDVLTVDSDVDGSAVSACLADVGVPAGWLTMFDRGDVADLVFHAWADGWLRATDVELGEIAKLLARLTSLTQAGCPWGVAAWHTLLGVAQDRYGDGFIVWTDFGGEL